MQLYNFPIEYLPTAIQHAVLEVHHNTHFPVPMVALSALSAAASACQNSVDVRLPTGQVSPTSLFTLVIAESGEGKTPSDSFFNKAFNDFEETQTILHMKLVKEFEATHATWLLEKDVLEQTLRKNKKNQLELKTSNEGKLAAEFEMLQAKYANHLESEPQKPKKFKAIYNNTTPEKLFNNMHSEWPSATLISSEAGSILQGHALKDMPSLNLLWDGSPISVDRISSESFILSNVRLSLSLMLQNEVFEKFKNGRGKDARGIGFFARFLMTAPASTKGFRTMSFNQQSWKALDQFNSRIHEILTKNFENNSNGRNILEFSEDARQTWIANKNNLEQAVAPGGYYSDVDDAVSKMHTNIARIAAIFHFFEGHEGDISQDTLTRAGEIAWWFLDEFQRIFFVLPPEVSDVIALEKTLYDWSLRHPSFNCIHKRIIAQIGPTALRKNSWRRENAITALHRQNKIQLGVLGKSQTLILNPDYFPVNRFYQ